MSMSMKKHYVKEMWSLKRWFELTESIQYNKVEAALLFISSYTELSFVSVFISIAIDEWNMVPIRSL